MSRVGKKPIELPPGVAATLDGAVLTVKGPLGTLTREIPGQLALKIEEGKVLILTRKNESKIAKSLHGLYRTLLGNMVIGVKQGFAKSLELTGIGYRAAVEGKNLNLQVGYTHPVVISPPAGVSFEIVGKNEIVIKGFDKEVVGQLAADIRATREIEPYKGKGLKYKGEWIKRKAGKAGKAGVGAPTAAA